MKCSSGNLATCWIYISQLRTRIPVPVHNSERLRSLHAYEKKKSARGFPQLSRRCPQSKIETDCWVSEGSVKNVSGGLDYGTRQRLRAGRSKPKAPKAPPEIREMSNVCRWRPLRVQEGPESVANHMLGFRCDPLEGKTGAWVPNQAGRLCFSSSMTRLAECWWFVGNNEYCEITTSEQITDRPGPELVFPSSN